MEYAASTPADADSFLPFAVANNPALIFSFCSLILAKFSPSFNTTPFFPSSIISPAAPILLPTDIIWSPSTFTPPPLEFITLPTFFIVCVDISFFPFSTPANTPPLFAVNFNPFDKCSSYLLLISVPGTISTPSFPLKNTGPTVWISTPSILNFPSESIFTPLSPYS